MIRSLLRGEAYPHPITTVEVRETHISWVLLTGQFAYKIKKPVDLGFVDFTTLERRHHYCQEELRLNSRYSSDLYLGVASITELDGDFEFDGDGPPVEYAVRMRQFDETLLAGTLLASGRLEAEELSLLARKLATIHEAAERVQHEPWGTPQSVLVPVEDNFRNLSPLLKDPARQSQLTSLWQWSERQGHLLNEVFSQRREQGFVRECHGDLHLGNITRWQGELTPFDCIEFNPGFRWIDVLSEIAFLLMDLDDHQRTDLGWRFLNAYLERTGDYEGLDVLRFYLVYRALVRAKVAMLRREQAATDTDEQERLATECCNYLDLATAYTTPRPVQITITYGLSGSGKTYGTQATIEQEQAIRIRSDVERKRLFGLAATGRAAGDIDSGLYTADASRKTYTQLVRLTESVIQAGYPVIVDATFLKRWQRQLFRDLADHVGVPFRILTFEASEEVLRKRIQQRMMTGDASDATLTVLDHQLQTREPLTSEELACVPKPVD